MFKFSLTRIRDSGRIMSEESFVNLVGKHLRYIYARLDQIDKTLAGVTKQVNRLAGNLGSLKATTKANEEEFKEFKKHVNMALGELKEITTLKSELKEFAEAFEKRLPPLPSPPTKEPHKTA